MSQLNPGLILSDPQDRITILTFHRWGESFSFYTPIPSILIACRAVKIQMGLASRTHTPDLAREMLKQLHISSQNRPSSSPTDTTPDSSKPNASEKPLRSYDLFQYIQIFPGSKTKHFERIQKSSGIPYGQMLFFDDELRNRNVETELGVTFHKVPDGVNKQEIDKGVWHWRMRQGIQGGGQ
jgi:magnesium-dependent phosphatase 1